MKRATGGIPSTRLTPGLSEVRDYCQRLSNVSPRGRKRTSDPVADVNGGRVIFCFHGHKLSSHMRQVAERKQEIQSAAKQQCHFFCLLADNLSSQSDQLLIGLIINPLLITHPVRCWVGLIGSSECIWGDSLHGWWCPRSLLTSQLCRGGEDGGARPAGRTTVARQQKLHCCYARGWNGKRERWRERKRRILHRRRRPRSGGD